MARLILLAFFLGLLPTFSAAQGAPPGNDQYQAALEHLTRKDHNAALDALDAAVAAGFRGLRQLQSATELEPLRKHPRFIKALADVRDSIFPCENGSKHHEFDFWIGSWDVYTADGNKAGHNKIRPAESHCLLMELWTGSSGVTGRSINYYDASKDKWRQQWVSPTGLLIDIAGNLEPDGSMLLTGTVFYPASGQEAGFRGRWTLLEDGRVRQFFEQHDVDADKWNPWFEGFYERVGD